MADIRTGGYAMLRHGKSQRSLDELYQDDPDRADALTFGRRGALKGASLAAMGAAVGATIPFATTMPSGLLPAALAQGAQGPTLVEFPGKVPMISRGERPLVTEAQETILDDDVTPASKFFIRNNSAQQ
jgi:sulfite oxidase